MPRVTRASSKKAKLGDDNVEEDNTFVRNEVKTTGTEDVKDKRKISQNGQDINSESDEDEAPESMSLSASKEAAIAEIHKEKETVDALKEKEKQRRRDRYDILKKQKESRRARELSRLPADILEKVARKQETVAKQQKEIKGANAIPPNVHVTFDSDDDENIEEEDVTHGVVDEEPKGLQVVVLNQASKNKKTVLDSASEFLKNHFYGDRLKRVETLNDENQKRKRRDFRPAIKFAKTAPQPKT